MQWKQQDAEQWVSLNTICGLKKTVRDMYVNTHTYAFIYTEIIYFLEDIQ